MAGKRQRDEPGAAAPAAAGPTARDAPRQGSDAAGADATTDAPTPGAAPRDAEAQRAVTEDAATAGPGHGERADGGDGAADPTVAGGAGGAPPGGEPGGDPPGDAFPRPETPSRWELLRDVVAFQIKLIVDGLRDVLLSPLSLVVAVFGLITDRRELFYELLVAGRRTERWINLFGAASRFAPEDDAEAPRHPTAARAGPAAAPSRGTAPTRHAEAAGGRGRRPAPPRRPPAPRRREGPPLRRAGPAAGSRRRGSRGSDAGEAAAQDARDAPAGNATPDATPTWYRDQRWEARATDDGPAAGADSIDDLIDKLEARLQEQYARGGMTARAKHTIDRLIDSLERRYREGRRDRR